MLHHRVMTAKTQLCRFVPVVPGQRQMCGMATTHGTERRGTRDLALALHGASHIGIVIA